MVWQAHAAEAMWTCLTVCLSNHDKFFISQKLKYQVKTPSRHNIAWIASFKRLGSVRFVYIFNLSCIKRAVKARSHKEESGLSRVVQVSSDFPYVLSQLHCDQSKSLSQTNQWDQACKKEAYHTPLPTGCRRYLVSICLRFEAFDERALLGTFLTIKIILSLIESDLTVISILRVADFSWHILFLSSLQEKQSSELFWLISERVRHFRPKVAFAKKSKFVAV